MPSFALFPETRSAKGKSVIDNAADELVESISDTFMYE